MFAKIAFTEQVHGSKRMGILSLILCLLLVCFFGNAYAEGDGMYFPRRPLSRSQAANCVFKRRLFSTYRLANPPLGKDDARDLELVYKPRADGSLDEFWDARFGGVCVNDVWLYEPVTEEGNRAVYTFDGPFPATGEGITISFFSSHPRDYVYIFFCLDRTKEIVSEGRRVYCDGPWSVVFLTYKFPPNQVKWCAAERDLQKTLGLTFDYEFNRFDPTLERCSQEPLPFW